MAGVLDPRPARPRWENPRCRTIWPLASLSKKLEREGSRAGWFVRRPVPDLERDRDRERERVREEKVTEARRRRAGIVILFRRAM